MNAILFTVLALQGADASVVKAAAMAGPEAAYAAGPSGYGTGMGGYGEACDVGDGGRHGRHGKHDAIHDWCGPMPQSCYNPSFGCYPSTRFMHRYPAFHNYHYRSAYNYRHYFDYPWHAGLHEPTSMFSYHVPAEAPVQPLPTPTPSAIGAGRTPAPRTAGAVGSGVYR
jgi:hypothetical protein